MTSSSYFNFEHQIKRVLRCPRKRGNVKKRIIKRRASFLSPCTSLKLDDVKLDTEISGIAGVSMNLFLGFLTIYTWHQEKGKRVKAKDDDAFMMFHVYIWDV